MSNQGQREKSDGIRYNKNIKRIAKDYAQNHWFVEYEFADIDPFYKDGISYDTLFFERSPFMRFKENDDFEKVFYFILKRTNRMIQAIYNDHPPLDAIIEALEQQFPDQLFVKEKDEHEINHGFIAFMAHAILKRLGYVRTTTTVKLSKGHSITEQFLYKTEEE